MKKVVVLAFMLGVVVLGCTVKPLDTADLPSATLDELMALHADPEAQIDRRVLRAELRKRLENASTNDLLSLRDRFIPEKTIFADYMWPYLVDTIKRDSLIVHGKVTEVNHDREALIRDILRKRVSITTMTITVKVLRQFPPEPSCDHVTYQQSVNYEWVRFVSKGGEGVFSFVKWRDQILGGSFLEVYPIGDTGVDRVTASEETPLAKMWQLVEEKFRAVTPLADNDTEARQAWMVKLRGDNLADTVAAVKLLTMRKETAPAPDELVGALERHYKRLDILREAGGGRLSRDWKNERRFREFSEIVAAALTEARDSGAIGRMYGLYLRDVSERSRPLFDEGSEFDAKIVAMTAADPGNKRVEHLTRLFTASPEIVYFSNETMDALADVPDTEIERIWTEMVERPQHYGLSSESVPECAWRVLAERGVMGIQATLERAAGMAEYDAGAPPQGATSDSDDPQREAAMEALGALAGHLPQNEAFELLVKLQRLGWHSAAWRLCELAGSDADAARPYLLRMNMDRYVVYRVSEEPFAHPDFLPKIEAARGKDDSSEWLVALAACGGVARAVDLATRRLEQSLDVNSEEEMRDLLLRRGKYVAFIAYHGQPQAVEALKNELSPETQNRLEGLVSKYCANRKSFHRGLYTRFYRAWLIAALLSCDPEEAMPFLREDSQSDDEDRSLFAALALLSLGDEVGAPLVQAYVRRESDYVGVPLSVVRSKRTDALLLKRLSSGLNEDDSDLVVASIGLGDIHSVSPFAEDNSEKLLPLLLHHIEKGDLMTRSHAEYCLTVMLGTSGERLPHCPTKEEERHYFDQWKALVEKYLAKRGRVLRMPPAQR